MRIGRLRYDLEHQASVLTIPLGGPFSMTYRSNLTPGFTAGLSSRVALVRDDVPDGLSMVSVTTSLDNHQSVTKYDAKPNVSHVLEADQPTRVAVAARYHFGDEVAPMRTTVPLGAPDAAGQGLGGFVLVGQPIVDGSTLVTAGGRSVPLTLAADNTLVGSHRGITYVVEGGVVVRGVDAITGRTVWESIVEDGRGRLVGPDGTPLEVERSGDDVRLTFEGSRTTISMSGFASKVVTESGEADLEMSPNGLLLSVDNGRRTELRYTDDGRLSDYITEQGHVVFRRDEHENGFTVGATDGADVDESVDVRTTSAGVVRTRRCCGRPPTRTTTASDRVIVERSDGSVAERVRNGLTNVTTVTLPSGATRTWSRTLSRAGDVVESRLEHAGGAWVTRLNTVTGDVQKKSPGGRTALSRYEDGRQTRDASLNGTWQEFEWGDDEIRIDGTFGESRTHFERHGTRIEYPFGTVEYEKESDGVRWTDANGVRVTERGLDGGAAVEVNGDAYLETELGDSRRVVTHGADVLASSDGGGVTLEGALQTNADEGATTLRGDGIDRTIDYAGVRVAGVRTPRHSTTLHWDGGELQSMEHAGVVTGSVGLGYDETGRIASVDILGQSFAIALDDGHLSQLGDLRIELDEDAIRPRRVSVGSLTETYEYDDAGRLIELVVEFEGREVFSDRRTYDDASRISKRRLGERKLRYQYDGDRLEGVRGADHRYEYDRSGRLVGMGHTTIELSAVGAPVAVDGAAITMTRGRRIESFGTTRLGYNALGELNEIDAGDGAISIERDGAGRPIEIDHNGRVRRIVWGTGGPAALLDGHGNVVERYVGLPGSRVPVLVVRGDTTHRLISDRNGSPLALIDVDTGETDTWEWSPYGTRLAGPDFLFGFSGGLELGAGITDIGARSYVAEIGRWLQWDPLLHYGGGTDLYGYAANDPINRYDPDGRQAKYCVGSANLSLFGWKPRLFDLIPHAWVGAGGRQRGQGSGPTWGGYVTEWKDEGDRESWGCVEVPFVDEDCVLDKTQPGTEIGGYLGPNGLIGGFPRICTVVSAEVLVECAVGLNPVNITNPRKGLESLWNWLSEQDSDDCENCENDSLPLELPPGDAGGAGSGATVGHQPTTPLGSGIGGMVGRIIKGSR